MQVAGVNVTPGHLDYSSSTHPLCFCKGTPPKGGIPITFWEPLYIIEVTRTPYKLSLFGDFYLIKPGPNKHGGISHVGETGRTSFYNVHFYKFPIMGMVDIFSKFSCLEKGSIELKYMSEFDPFWNDDQWANILAPQNLLFANPLAQTACITDCLAANMNKPQDKLFWCGGCYGSLYPLTGHISNHIGGIQASALIVQRALAKLHSLRVLGVFEENEFCQPEHPLLLKKTAYKMQLIKPIPQTSGDCIPLGKSDIFWGTGKTYPYGGEDFTYLIWRKRHCCLDAIKPAMKALTSGATP